MMRRVPVVLPDGPARHERGLLAGHPLHRRSEVELDGMAVRIRPVLPLDADAVLDAFRRLSPRTRYLRYHVPVDRLSPSQLQAIVDVDHAERETMTAWVRARGRWRIAGVARYVGVAADRAEMAVVVADAYQGHGIGRVLSRSLAEAAVESGFRTLVGPALDENAAAVHLAGQVGLVAMTPRPGGQDLVCRLRTGLSR
jgi:GNAT superfamily N-acetyltransferase